MNMQRLQLLAIMIIVVYLALFVLTALLHRRLSKRGWSMIIQILVPLAALYPIVVLILSVAQMLAPRRAGLLALSQVLAPYLFLPLLLWLPFTLFRGTRLLRWLLALCACVAVLRFIPPLHQPKVARPEDVVVQAMTWNVGMTGPADQERRVRALLEKQDTDIVALQESYWEWLAADPTLSKRYVTQLKHTPQASSGLVLLSTYIAIEHGVLENPPELRGWPRVVWARLDVEGKEELLVIAAHPESPYSSIGRCRFPNCYDTAERDMLITRVRSVIDIALARGDHVLVLGDFNTTTRELAYHGLARGLRDAHRDAGRGPGLTWGLPLPSGRTVPLLRIDHILSSSNLRALEERVDCTKTGSDHCVVYGRFTVSSD